MKVNVKQIRSKDGQLSLFICMYLLLNIVNSTIQNVLHLSDGRLTSIRMIIQIILMLILVKIIHKMQIKDFLKYCIGVFGVVCIFGYCYLVCNESFSAMKSWFTTMLVECMPLCVSAYLIKDKKTLYKYLLKFSWPMLGVLLIDGFFSSNVSYDMHFSYCILLLILIHISEAIRRKSIRYISLSILEFLLMLFFGARGAIVCVGVYLVLQVLFSDSDKGLIKRIYSSISLIAITSLLYLVFMKNLSFIGKVLQNFNISSRTINLLIAGKLTASDSGRARIWKFTQQLISEKMFGGWGIGGASQNLGAFYNGIAYPHNILLDLWLSFGVILGTIFIILLCMYLRKMFILHTGEEQQVVFVFFSISCCLIFTGSLFTNYYFFILLGLLISINKKDFYNHDE